MIPIVIINQNKKAFIMLRRGRTKELQNGLKMIFYFGAHKS